MSSCLHSRWSQYNNRSGRTRPHHSHKCAGNRESPEHTCHELTRSGAGKKQSHKLQQETKHGLLGEKCLPLVPTSVENESFNSSTSLPCFERSFLSFPISHIPLVSPFIAYTPFLCISCRYLEVPSQVSCLQHWGCLSLASIPEFTFSLPWWPSMPDISTMHLRHHQNYY